MKNRRDYDAALAAEYALGTLRGAARQRFARRLPLEPELHAEVCRWQHALTELDQLTPPVTPPEAVWQRIARSLPANPSPVRPLRWPWLGWALAASFAGALLYNQLTPVPVPQAVAVLSSSDHTESWVVSVNPAGNRLIVQGVNAAAIPVQHSLQLWLIPAGEKPQSLGLLDATARIQLAVQRQQLGHQPLLAISLEPQGGSPTGQPTGPVLFSGKLTQL